MLPVAVSEPVLTPVYKCYGSMAMERGRASRVGLGESFFAEAKRLVNFENGRPSIPAVQALLVMFSYSCRMGRDRAGSIFRASAYEMMVRMMPRIQSTLSNGDYPLQTRRAISRATCGIFCFDRSALTPLLPTRLLAAAWHRRLTTSKYLLLRLSTPVTVFCA